MRKAHGRGSFEYSVYSPVAAKNPRGAFAFAPDGKTVYVPDSATDNVAAVDVESGKRVADIDAPESVAEVTPVGRTIVAIGEKSIALIDTASNSVAQRLDLRSELRDLFVLPDGATALALSKGDVAVVDGQNARVAVHVTGLIDPVAAVVAAK